MVGVADSRFDNLLGGLLLQLSRMRDASSGLSNGDEGMTNITCNPCFYILATFSLSYNCCPCYWWCLSLIDDHAF